jgi:hypothetical protein
MFSPLLLAFKVGIDTFLPKGQDAYREHLKRENGRFC